MPTLTPKISRFIKPDLGAYLIADGGIVEGKRFLSIVEEAIAAGIRFLQYREKILSRRETFEYARLLRDLTREKGVTFIINDYLEIAMGVDADGLHLGQEDLPLTIARRILGKDKIIGISTHNLLEAKEAEEGGADYIGLGPIFETRTKLTGPPIGIKKIEEVRKEIDIPIFAIGGINHSNLGKVLISGVDGVAVSSAIMKAEDIEKSVRKLLAILISYHDSGRLLEG